MSAALKGLLGLSAFLAWMGLAFGELWNGAPTGAGSASPVETVRQLEGRVLYRGDRLAMPIQIAMLGGRIVLADGFASHPIHVLDADGRYLSGLGRRGEGPGEFRWPRILGLAPAQGWFWVYDAELARATFVDPDRWMAGATPDPATVSLRGPAFIGSVARKPGGGFLATGFFAGGRLGHYAESGVFEGTSGPLPPSRSDAPPEVLQHAWRGQLKADPSGTRFVLANRHAGRLEVYSVEGRLQRRIHGPLDFAPRFEVARGANGPSLATGGDLRFGYLDVSASESRIYGLFSGRTRSGHPEDATYGREVHVFDWEGRLRSIQRLDADVFAITVDPGRGRLLAVSHIPEPSILWYPLAP